MSHGFVCACVRACESMFGFGHWAFRGSCSKQNPISVAQVYIRIKMSFLGVFSCYDSGPNLWLYIRN